MSGETEANVSGWSTDTLKAYFDQRLTDLVNLLDERFATQTQASRTAFSVADAAVDRALSAAEKAVDQRASTLDREFHEHLEQVRHENALAFLNSDKAVSAALESQQRAVAKAETASEKRFECVPVETLVETLDGMVPVGDLRPGDLLADLTGFTRVVSNILGEEELVMVMTTVGPIRSTRRHPWLARSDGGGYQWIEAGDLTAGWRLWRTDGRQEVHSRVRVQAAPERDVRSYGENQGTSARSEVGNEAFARVDRQGAGNDEDERDRHEGQRRRVPRGACTAEERPRPSRYLLLWLRETRHRLGLRPLGSGREVVAGDGVLHEPEQVQANVQRMSHDHGQEDEGDAVVVAVVPSGRGAIARLETTSHTYLVDGFGAHNSVNEFRAQLTDQASTFVSRLEADARRSESDARMEALGRELQTATGRNAERIQALESRMDTLVGQMAGAGEAKETRRLDTGLMVSVGVGLVVVLGLVATVVGLLTR